MIGLRIMFLTEWSNSVNGGAIPSIILVRNGYGI